MKREEFWLGVFIYAIVIALGYAGPALKQMKWLEWNFSSVSSAVKTISTVRATTAVQSPNALSLRPLASAPSTAPVRRHLSMELKVLSGRRTASMPSMEKPKRGFGTEADTKAKPGNREADSKQS